jgi:hypothetical protein
MTATTNRKRFPLTMFMAALLGGSALLGGRDALAQVAPVPTPEQALLDKLGKGRRLLVGLGNDPTPDPASESAYHLGTPLDIHYLYLSGLPGEDAWTEWDSGRYLEIHAEAMKAAGVVPMFTLYQAATRGDGNLAPFADAAFMTSYWRGVRTMYEKLAALGVPSIVHLEPDFWGYAQKRSDDPAAVPVRVASHVPECADLPNDVGGFGKCMVRLGRLIAPKTAVALQASSFAAMDALGRSDPARIAAYLGKVGAADADLVVVETLDRDAGCFEAGIDPGCKRAGGGFYWDESNATSPSFHDHLAWAKAIHDGTAKPLLWWQMPLGVAGPGPGGPGRYRDNRVRYFFSHPQEFADAGGIGAVFGPGAPNQTTALTDGGQFAAALTQYNRAPTPK